MSQPANICPKLAGWLIHLPENGSLVPKYVGVFICVMHIDIDILFTFHESTITINRIQNMLRVIYKCMEPNILIPSQVHE